MFLGILASFRPSPALFAARALSTLPVSKRIAIVGGGASGIFSAVSAAEHYLTNYDSSSQVLEIVVLEATSKTLSKVAISGGGRCNVLHDTSKPTSEILNGYPRGKKELTGLLSSRFTPQQAQAWFLRHGVTLKTEPDGRMFPITDSSQTVIDALLEASQQGNMVEIRKRQKVSEITVINNDKNQVFQLSTQQKDPITKEKTMVEESYDAIILATGSSPIGYQLAQSILEQSADDSSKAMISPVPSLFTMNTKLDIKEEGCLLYGLAGVSVPKAHVRYQPEESKEMNTSDNNNSPPTPKPKRKRNKKPPAHLQQEGPLLVTHHGVSGPAVLRLSAFGARDFHAANYRGNLRIHWAPDLGNAEDIAAELWKMTQTNPKRLVVTGCPLYITTTIKDSSSSKEGFADKTMAAIPKRLWYSLVVNACGIDPETTWAQVNKKAVRKLASSIADTSLQVTGKGTFKEEFVTAGGVALKEIDMKTMMSKSCPGLFLCGEVINVDGVTGGFNFMNCWGTGHVAGTSAVDFVLHDQDEEASILAIEVPNKKKKPQPKSKASISSISQ